MRLPEHEAVVVTGASSGIGAAAAERFAREGFVTFAGVRNDADAARVAAMHANMRPLRLDVTDRASIDAAAATVAAGGLSLRAVVNNAGVAVAGPLEFLPVDELRRQFEVNLFGPIAVSQAFLPQLRASRGRLIFVGSISGRLAVPFIAPYSASKFALRALTDALRVELGPAGVAVTLVEPGSVKTPIWSKGRASRPRFEALLPARATELYGPQLQAVFANTEQVEAHAMPVDAVTAVLLRVLTARRPKPRYLIGSDARAGSVIALLPPSVRDRAMRASMKLPS